MSGIVPFGALCYHMMVGHVFVSFLAAGLVGCEVVVFGHTIVLEGNCFCDRLTCYMINCCRKINCCTVV
jgi:hypothetical protein